MRLGEFERAVDVMPTGGLSYGEYRLAMKGNELAGRVLIDVPLPEFPTESPPGDHAEPAVRAGRTASAAYGAALGGETGADPLALYLKLRDHPLGPTGDTQLQRDLILARLAARLGRDEDSDRYFVAAIDWARSARHMPRIVEACVPYAEFLLERNTPGDREKANELQDEAIAIAPELGMQPLLERVLAQRDILKA